MSNASDRRDGGDLASRDARHVWHPYTQHATEGPPLPVASAGGAVLTLADGRELIDAISSWWTCLHGHARPELLAALAAQAETLDHVLFAGTTHEPAVALAEELLAVAPPGLSRVFYSDNGSTAVEVALKIAYQSWVHAGQPQRTVFVALRGSYHGDTVGAMAVGDPEPFFTAYAPLLFSVRRAAVDTHAVQEAIADLGERCAGVIVEPLVQGAAGMVMHEPSFLFDVRAACDAAGVPLIVDEVMTGFGRTGTLFACAQAGIAPDLMCLAKGLTGGLMPLAATLATERLFEAFLSDDRARMFFHGHSFTAHPMACAVARASLALVREEDTPARLDGIGRKLELSLRARLRAEDPDHARTGPVRRTGGIVALDLAPARDTGGGSASLQATGGYLAGIAPRLRAAAVERGVLLRPLGNVLYAMPPSCTTEAQAERIAAVMAELALLD
ncbi:MAG: adenosylmethionine--8-amino-7-oxononanoate transaminase [Planctomycetota bacterium]|jgi:adenosylmethionine-8-amino-7-oxononanoate aminotransferase